MCFLMTMGPNNLVQERALYGILIELRLLPTGVVALKRRASKGARLEGSAPLQRLPVYEAQAVILSLAFSFSFAISVCAAGPEECGF